MRASLALLMLVASMAGCLADSEDIAGQGVEDNSDGAPDGDFQTSEPFHVDERHDLRRPFDETWTWSMSPDMTGRVTIEHIPDPVSKNEPRTVCYELVWPEGRHSQCSQSLGAVTYYSSQEGQYTETETVYDVRLLPNEFTLRVWQESDPDTAYARIYIETWVAEES